jgi:hypothetical protein
MIVAPVLNEVLETGCRFLKKDRKTGRWYQMNREQAHDKTGHALRDMIRYSEKQRDCGENNNDNPWSSSAEPYRFSSKSKACVKKSTVRPRNSCASYNSTCSSTAIDESFTSICDDIPDEVIAGLFTDVSNGEEEKLNNTTLSIWDDTNIDPIDWRNDERVNHLRNSSITSADLLKALDVLTMKDS